MNDFLEELGTMELSVEETRQILRRLAMEEFGGSESPRVRDLVEVTGVPTEIVGRILAELRGESWVDWKADIERRLTSLEGREPAVDEEWRRQVESQLHQQGKVMDALRMGSAERAAYYEKLEDMALAKEKDEHRISFDLTGVPFRRNRLDREAIIWTPEEVAYALFLTICAVTAAVLLIKAISGR